MSQWVQSKYSKDARKFEVCSEDCKYYNVMDNDTWASPLLKSEYVPCDPPTRWETCTRGVVRIDSNGSLHFIMCMDDKRWSWEGDALIIQRRVQS